ncbi:amino acid synthesis protein [Paracoccus versutus]|uniref:Amino acid synthesis protein n=1 Tax=Paracoccus versutus TaxID=34007 RepID=A0AAQ0KLA0_PARVE|nr:amino acid synthesis protein [Paracoccus versutus]
MVGLDGEVEHASALIHTLRFGNQYRSAVGAKSYLAFTNTRGPAHAPIMIPLMDKNDEGRRSHYLAIQFAIPDAPAADEIVVVLGASVGGRPHHRIGDAIRT